MTDHRPRPIDVFHDECMARAEAERVPATDPAEAHRLVLSDALGLGTSAPWEAIRERAAELSAPSAVVSADRATLLREAADIAEDVAEGLRKHHEFERSTGALDAMTELRQKANEAEFAATPCSPVVPCEDGGEPCDVHERLLGHYDDSHELCAPGCKTTTDGSRLAAEQPTETQDTLPAWLAQRFDPRGADWDGMSDDDRSYWEHQARAVRRAVERGGFKPTAEQPDTQTREADRG